jgi:hypothetical protein
MGALTGALAGAACGGAPPPAPTQHKVEVPPPAPQPSGVPAPPDGKATELAAQARKAFAALPGYRTKMRYMQKNGSKISRGLCDIAGKPPLSMRIEIFEGESVGTKLAWFGGNKVKVRPGGLLSPIVVDLSLTDERLVSVRGYNLSQTNLDSLLKMLADPQGRLTYTGKSGGDDVVATTGGHLLTGCNKMVAILDGKSHIPKQAELSDGREIVFQVKLTDFRPESRINFDI